MSISAWIDRLPIEDWAATAARIARRTRRKVARRPIRSAALVLGTVTVATIASNALWDQSERHPAPLWTDVAVAESGDEAPLVASHAPARDADAANDPLVLKVQNALGEKGFFDGEPDGRLGEDTTEAIRKFEAFAGIPVTGAPSVALLAAIATDTQAPEPTALADVRPVDATPAPEPRTVSAVREQVVSVEDIQGALNTHGYGPLSVDGVMGPMTRAALDRFAADKGMAGQGMTPQVLQALAEAPG